MKIYLTRHGETDWNKQMLIQGITDNPLNCKGLEQASEIKLFFDSINIDLTISSSLQRAITTATIATNQEPDIIDDLFIERDFGDLEGQNVKCFYEHPNRNQVPNFETDIEIVNRVHSGLTHYANQDFEKIAIFAHSHVLKAALSSIEPETYSFSSKIKNCAIVELEYTNNEWSVVEIH